MLKRALLSFCAAYYLTGCVGGGDSALLNSGFMSGQKTTPVPMHVIEPMHKNESLRAWWSFFGDETLDRLVSTALRLTPERMDIQNGQSPSPDMSHTNIVTQLVRDYTHYRYIQGQSELLATQIKTLRAYVQDNQNTRNQTKPARIYDKTHQLAQRQKDLEGELSTLSGRIADLTHSLPEYVKRVLEDHKPLPTSDILPLLASSSASVEDTLEVRQAKTKFIEIMQGHINGTDIYPVFTDITVGEFFGIPNSVYLDSQASWNLRAGTFAKHISFDKFEKRFGGYDEYREMQSNITHAVLGYEQQLVSYAHLQEQYITLKSSADKARENEKILSAHNRESQSFQSIMKIHDEALELKQAALKAEYEKLKILVNLYIALGTR